MNSRTSQFDLAATFLEGNWLYNLVNLSLALIGFAVVFWQTWKARKAADAARLAAQRTADGFHRLKAMTDFSTLGRLAEDIVSYIDGNNFRSAQLRLLDLRNGLARAREFVATSELRSPLEWDDILNTVKGVDDRVSTLAELENPGMEVKIICRQLMSGVSESLSGLTERANRKAEPITEN
jgi:hypothetical protein